MTLFAVAGLAVLTATQLDFPCLWLDSLLTWGLLAVGAAVALAALGSGDSGVGRLG